MKAFAWASGHIEFGQRVPAGAVCVLNGPARAVRKTVEATARHAYVGKTLLVPGVPEADDQAAAMTALMGWRDWITPGFERRLAEQVQS